MTDDPYPFDVFVSYRHQDPDKTWVRKRFVPDLEAAGLRACIDYRDFRLGYQVLTEMERAVEQSRWTVAVLSPAYLEGNFTELENVWAQHLGQKGGQPRLIWVDREPCAVKSVRISASLRLDLTTDDAYAEGLPRLIATLKQPEGAAR